MSCFEGIDLNMLFDNESDYGKTYTFGELTDELVSRAEETMGYKLPESYKELLRFKNGGVINDELDELQKTAADLPRNEQLRLCAELIDKHIFQGYNLAWTNIAAKEILEGYEDEKFEIYLQAQLDKIVMPKGIEKDIPFLRERILELYANPAINQYNINNPQQ